MRAHAHTHTHHMHAHARTHTHTHAQEQTFQLDYKGILTCVEGKAPVCQYSKLTF